MILSQTERGKKWRKINLTSLEQKKRNRESHKRWLEKNPEKNRQSWNNWYAKNKERSDKT